MQKRGYITIFRWKFFLSQYQKISEKNPTVFQKNSDIEKFNG